MHFCATLKHSNPGELQEVSQLSSGTIRITFLRNKLYGSDKSECPHGGIIPIPIQDTPILGDNWKGKRDAERKR